MSTFCGRVYTCWEPQRSAHLYLPVLDYKCRTSCLAHVCGFYVFLYWQRSLSNPKVYIFNVLRCSFLIFHIYFWERHTWIHYIMHEYYITSYLSYVYSLFHVLHHLSNSWIFVFIFLYLYIFVAHTHTFIQIYTCVYVIQYNLLSPVSIVVCVCVPTCDWVINYL